jgi:cytochrome P450 PksS
MFWWLPPFMRPMLSTLIVRDGEDHRRLRRLVEIAFAKATIADLRPQIVTRADQLLDVVGTGRDVDIETAFTRPLPFDVISALLGLPDALRTRAARDLAPLSHIRGTGSALLALTRLRGVMRAFRADLAHVRQHPRPGLVSDLVAARDGTDQLTQDELLAMVMTLFLAGHETTVHLLNHAIFALVSDPALMTHFRTHPDTRHLMIEEFLRYWSPVVLTKVLIAREDLEFMGEPVRKGERLAAFLLAANYDPAAAEEPDTMQPERRPNAHLAFGFGPHVCLGMQLARAETEIALDRLFARFPEASLSGTGPDWLRRPGLRARTGLRLDLS